MDSHGTDHNFTPSRRLNFIIAVCAIGISLASFIATYFQAQSEAAQAKAMTYPLIQFTSSNYDSERNQQQLKLVVKNQGVGPALVKRVRYHYLDQSYNSLYDFLLACCTSGFQEMNQRVKEGAFNDSVEYAIITASTNHIILPANESVDALTLNRHALNANLWDQINRERWKLSVEVCYCSLLQDCYKSKGIDSIIEVSSCDDF